MDILAPDHYWKTPFIWEPGSPTPPTVCELRFEVTSEVWLRGAIAEVMSNSLDESDQYTVTNVGIEKAVDEVFDVSKRYFEERVGWWRTAVDGNGEKVGFVLTTVFAEPSHWKDERPQGTILYMGVLPQFRGKGYALELILEATRTCIAANCWRISCDTGSSNEPMIAAFRSAGYQERQPWQRRLA